MLKHFFLVTIILYSVGTYITTASPDDVCSLDEVATECADLTATVCTSDPGFRIQGSSYVGICIVCR